MRKEALAIIQRGKELMDIHLSKGYKPPLGCRVCDLFFSSTTAEVPRRQATGFRIKPIVEVQ